ncbi:MAG: ArsR/SmtB family transcription factor [Candidatus Nanohaloarchaea archaeon]
MDEYEYAEFFQVLSQQARMKILFELEEDDRSVSELTEIAECGQSCVSHHLKKLNEVGIVERKKQGNRRIYSLNQELFHQLIESVSEHS